MSFRKKIPLFTFLSIRAVLFTPSLCSDSKDFTCGGAGF